MARTKKKNPRRRRRSRRNPSGGFLPALGGFLAVPILDGLIARASVAVSPAEPDPPGIIKGSTEAMTVATRGQVLDVGAAVAAWASSDRVRDPGWHSFLRGGMWGAIVSAVLRPVVTAFALATARPVVARADDQNVDNIPVV